MDSTRLASASPVLIVLISWTGMSLALHITRVVVPTPLAVGEGGFLECHFLEEGGETIYALKWYLGLDEFYRWTPAEVPPVRTFSVKGEPLKVDLAESREGSVRIREVTLGADGVFRCEVSAEGPSFHTASQAATMTVLDLPDEGPAITGAEGVFQTNEEVLLNCSSYHSQPPATLSFYINSEPVNPSWLIHYPPQEDPSTGLETSVLGLRLLLRPHFFHRDVIVVKCLASIPSFYWSDTEELLRADQPRHASVMKGHATTGRGCTMAVSDVILLLASGFLLRVQW